MSKLSRGLRNAMGNAPKPAWICCPGQRTFCFCITIRTGASVIGWFNFVFNSLYVGMLVFALARTKESVGKQMSIFIEEQQRMKMKPTNTLEGSGALTIAENLPSFYARTCLRCMVAVLTAIVITNNQQGRAELTRFPIQQNKFDCDKCACISCKEMIGDRKENHVANKQLEGSSVLLASVCGSSSHNQSCVCNPKSYISNENFHNTSKDCSYVSPAFSPTDCLCDLAMILYNIIPMMYKSLGIPGFMVLLSILWLTAVESKSIRFLRSVGFLFLFAIPIQLALQLYYQIYTNKKFIENNLGSLHGIVWLVYSVYALLNLYYIPVLHRYVKLRTRECAQGIEQGLLTSERHPPSNRALDVYLDDAFAIDDSGDADRVCYSISAGNSDPMKDYLSSNQKTTVDSTKSAPSNEFDTNFQIISTSEDQPICKSSDDSDSI